MQHRQAPRLSIIHTEKLAIHSYQYYKYLSMADSHMVRMLGN